MRHVILFAIIITFSMASRAAEPLTGYVVLANNDTVQCKIKAGKFLNNPFHGITVINEQGEEETLPSRDKKIIAFGFVERLITYHYKFVDVGDKTENGFYQMLVNGVKYKLYTRPTTIYGGNATYVLVNPDQQFTKFEPCLLCPWKKQLRELLKDDPKALELVETASRVDIPKFAREINKVSMK